MSQKVYSSIVMVGTAMNSPGGMTAVVRSYEEAGLFDKWNISYFSSYETSGVTTQLRVMSLVALRLLREMLAGHVALIHVHSASRGSFWRKSLLCALAKLFGVPYIFHVHSGEFPDFYFKECGRIAQWWVRRTLSGATAVVALTERWREALSQIAPGADVITIANPVAMPLTHLLEDRPLGSVLFLGRLREKKGVFDLVNAIPKVLDVFPETRFILAGDGEVETVARQARSLGVSENLELPGWVDGEAKNSLLASASVLVLPSYFEGLPICVLEAMAEGVPVVTTTVGGIPEVVEYGKCAWLLAPGDIEGLSVALIEALSDSEKRQAVRHAARDRVARHYSTSLVIGQIESLYRQVIEASEGKA